MFAGMGKGKHPSTPKHKSWTLLLPQDAIACSEYETHKYLLPLSAKGNLDYTGSEVP